MTMTTDQALSTLRDPQADPAALAQVAYLYPPYRPMVVVHPRTYPELQAWIASAGDRTAESPVVAGEVDAVAVSTAATHDGNPAGSRLVWAYVLAGLALVSDTVIGYSNLLNSLGYVGENVVIVILQSGFLVIAVAVAAESAARKLTAVGIVVVSCVVRVLVMEVFLLQSLYPQGDPAATAWTGWTANLALAAAVCAWLIARSRPPASFVVAPLVALAQFGLRWVFPQLESMLLDQLRVSGAVIPYYVVAGLVFAAIDDAVLVAACFFAASAVFRRKQPSAGDLLFGEVRP